MTQLKLSFVSGLKEIVLEEIKKYTDIQIIRKTDEELYLDTIIDFQTLKKLRSVSRVYVIQTGPRLNPIYISKHKSVLGELIEKVLHESGDVFKTFKLSCAGSDSPEIHKIKDYIIDTYKLVESETADLKIHIIKPTDIWEIAVQITAKPLSLREYKVENIKGGMNPTIAYAMNAFIDLEKTQSYLNIFSGSATLLIEAGLSNPNIKLLGFDKDGKTNSLAIKNIKKAGLIKSIQLKTADILEEPELGTFDAIVSDLPFGMLISKGEDLSQKYQKIVEYSENHLSPDGILVLYTSEYELLEKILKKSLFETEKVLNIKVLASLNTYLYAKIFVCKFK